MSEEEYDALPSAEEQQKAIRDYIITSFLEDGYTPCAVRHNNLVDWYLDNEKD